VKVLWSPALAAALSLTAAVGGPLVAGTAHAEKVTTGTLSFSGDSGDYISQGDSWSYSTSNGDALSATGSKSKVSIGVNAYNGDRWTLTFDAPDRATASQPAYLAPGTYTGAHRYPFNGTGPGLDLSGEGRGCNELTGSFTITKAVFGSGGYVQAFDATFEQHCEGGTPAARGKVHISNPAQSREAAPNPATTTRRPAATTRPHTTATRPPAATTGPAATPTGTPSATAAGIGDTVADDTDANDSGANDSPTLASNTAFEPLMLFGLSVVALVGLVAVGLLTVGVVMHLRGR
jgi:hypothetical protein